MNQDPELIDEPDLLVGKSKLTKDIKLGLLEHGPYRDDEPGLGTLNVGIVGNSSTVGKMTKFLKRAESGLRSDDVSDLVTYPPFPRFSSDSIWNCDLRTKDDWEKTLTTGEIKRTDNIDEVEERIGYIADRYEEKLERIAKQQDSPDVIICTIPDKIDENCGTKLNYKERSYLQGRETLKEVETGSQHDLFDFSDDEAPRRAWNLRRALKIKAIELKTPIQIVREETIDDNMKSANMAWNVFSALYYKAGGLPWKLNSNDPQTCYIGISFYRDQKAEEEYLRTAIAQVFTPGGDSLVLEGGNAIKDDKIPRLPKDQAEELIDGCIDEFERMTGNEPNRIVIHKKSPYHENELEGIKQATQDIDTKDLLSLGPSSLRLLRHGRYPVPRGLLLKNQNEMYLYTFGYIPEVGTYPGTRIPKPLVVRLRYNDTPYQKLASEILALSKLSWNNTEFATKEPITTEFSQKVGHVMSEMSEDEKEELSVDDFRYYM